MLELVWEMAAVEAGLKKIGVINRPEKKLLSLGLFSMLFLTKRYCNFVK